MESDLYFPITQVLFYSGVRYQATYAGFAEKVSKFSFVAVE